MVEKRFKPVFSGKYNDVYIGVNDNVTNELLMTLDVINLLNDLSDENQRWEELSVEDRDSIERLKMENECLKQKIEEITSEFEGYYKSLEEPIKEHNEQFEVTSCPYEIRNNESMHYYWLEDKGNVIGLCKLLNEQSHTITKLRKDMDNLVLKTAEKISERQKKILHLIDVKLKESPTMDCDECRNCVADQVLLELKKGIVD